MPKELKMFPAEEGYHSKEWHVKIWDHGLEPHRDINNGGTNTLTKKNARSKERKPLARDGLDEDKIEIPAREPRNRGHPGTFGKRKLDKNFQRQGWSKGREFYKEGCIKNVRWGNIKKQALDLPKQGRAPNRP